MYSIINNLQNELFISIIFLPILNFIFLFFIFNLHFNIKNTFNFIVDFVLRYFNNFSFIFFIMDIMKNNNKVKPVSTNNYNLTNWLIDKLQYLKADIYSKNTSVFVDLKKFNVDNINAELSKTNNFSSVDEILVKKYLYDDVSTEGGVFGSNTFSTNDSLFDNSLLCELYNLALTNPEFVHVSRIFSDVIQPDGTRLLEVTPMTIIILSSSLLTAVSASYGFIGILTYKNCVISIWGCNSDTFSYSSNHLFTLTMDGKSFLLNDINNTNHSQFCADAVKYLEFSTITRDTPYSYILDIQTTGNWASLIVFLIIDIFIIWYYYL